jgi:uncharacterized membrane protein
MQCVVPKIHSTPMNDANSPKSEETRSEASSSPSGNSAEELPNPELVRVLRRLPDAERRKLLEAVERDPQVVSLTLKASTSLWRGPLPHPDDLRAYGEISPDLPDRIVRMTEREQAHRHGIDDRLDQSRSLGQKGALALALLGIVFGFVLLLLGKTVEGSIFGGTPLVLLIGAFIGGRVFVDDRKNKGKPVEPS